MSSHQNNEDHRSKEGPNESKTGRQPTAEDETAKQVCHEDCNIQHITGTLYSTCAYNWLHIVSGVLRHTVGVSLSVAFRSCSGPRCDEVVAFADQNSQQCRQHNKYGDAFREEEEGADKVWEE